MSKTKLFVVVVVTIILSWIFSISAGRVLTAKIFTWPVLNRWKILSPDAPIVITKYETVRVSDSGDVLTAANSAKSKISVVVLVAGGNASVVGGAMNLTSDGVFVTAASVFSPKNDDNYFVVLSDGSQALVSNKVTDPATSLVFFKAKLNNVPTASLGKSADLAAGDKAVFISNSLQNFMDKVEASTVSSSQADVSGQLLQSDYPGRSFNLPANPMLLPGQSIINTEGEIVGLWNGSRIISSDVLKKSMALYFAGQQKITRPSFGFNYSIVGQSESKLTGTNEGALVKNVLASSSANVAGLSQGDVITAIDGQTVSESSPLEEQLQNYKPDDKALLSVFRKNQKIDLHITVGELK